MLWQQLPQCGHAGPAAVGAHGQAAAAVLLILKGNADPAMLACGRDGGRGSDAGRREGAR